MRISDWSSDVCSSDLFIFAILVTLLTLLRYWETEERTWLLACGIGVGAASLVRFTAPPLGAAIAICLLINPRHPLRQRILDACRIAVVSGSIFVLWTFASEALVGRSSGPIGRASCRERGGQSV